jgi:hypothetical protein
MHTIDDNLILFLVALKKLYFINFKLIDRTTLEEKRCAYKITT